MKPLRRAPRIALSILLAIAVLAAVFRFVPLDGVGEVLRDTRPGYFVLGITLQFVMRAVATIRMRVITADQGMSLGHRALFRILLVSQFYSQVVPGPMVGGSATWLKYVQSGASSDAAVAGILLHRTLATLVAIGVGAAAWVIHVQGMTPLAVAGALAIITASFAPAFVRVPHGMAPESTSSWRVRRWLHRVVGRLLQFQHVPIRGKLIVLLGSLVFEAIAAMSFWSYASALSIPVDPLDVVWIRIALQLALMAPLTIAGLGVREASLVGLGSLVGVAAPACVAWSLLVFCGVQVVAAVGGLIEAHAMAGRAHRRMVARASSDRDPGGTR